ncbi:hypothetical protein G6F65_020725 [Rhizopus arrhizus]|nr:hypothetical protein G6F65_020725 [Rhizopus arrhizus]
MGEQPGGDHAEAFPDQLAAQFRPLGQAVAGTRQRDQRPFPVPVLRRALVDALRGVCGMAQPLFGNQVEAAAPMAFGLQPVLGDQPEDAGAQQPRVDAQRRQHRDQVAQPYGAAMGGERVPQQADAQGFGAGRIAFQ